jgi:acyl-CoA reductase-like NAD-dependent aldehyde dehydrogenase
MAIATVNPATGETERTFEPHTDAEVEQRIANASAGFQELSRTRSPTAPAGCGRPRICWKPTTSPGP